MGESPQINHDLPVRPGLRAVVKLGGSAMEEPVALAATMDDIVQLAAIGVRIVVVHGGGKAIDRALDAAGIVPMKVRGRRITDRHTLDVVVHVLATEINACLVDHLKSRHVEAAGLHSGSKQTLFGSILHSPDGNLGFVGQVDRVDVDRLDAITAAGVIPIIPSLARDDDGGWLNVNADDAATAVAIAWRANTLVFLTDTPGILADVKDPKSRHVRLTESEIRRQMDAGAIAGGMIPKVEGCLATLKKGIGRVLILDGRVEHALMSAMMEVQIEGTEIAL